MAGFFGLALRVFLEYVTHLLGSSIFWIVLLLFAVQYRKVAKTRQKLWGGGAGNFLLNTVVAAVYGIAGGFVGSSLLVLTGINLAAIGISYLWGLALLLMFINPRFLCFAYSGGIIALCKLFFGGPEVDVPQLMGLIATLHLVESLLIYFSGHTGAIPMVFKKADGRLVGGFSLQKFWPLPIVAVAILPLPDAAGYSVLPPMPSWWPLIGVGSSPILSSVGVLLPFIAGLGYGDIALAHTPSEKSRVSSLLLGIFSLVLLVLALISPPYPAIQFVAAAFAPIGHEMVIYFGQRMEVKQQPLYIPSLRGVRILEVLPGSPFHKAGITTGDVVFSVNGQPVNNKHDFESVMSGQPGVLEIEFITRTKNMWRRAAVGIQSGEPVGVITVPEGYEQVHSELKRNESVFVWIAKKLNRT